MVLFQVAGDNGGDWAGYGNPIKNEEEGKTLVSERSQPCGMPKDLLEAGGRLLSFC